MEIKYFDVHSHLNLSQFDEDREEVIQKLKDKNIYTITVGADYKSSLLAVELADKHENLYAAVGLHPSDVFIEEFNYEKILDLAQNKKVVAIGECGLDYFRDNSEEFKRKQKEIFELHIKIAIKTNKTLMIHARPTKGSMDAYEDVLMILENYKKDYPEIRANFHFFAGNLDIANKIINLGFTISFDGPITFSTDYDELIKNVPIEYIMVETDSPFAAPLPYRGKRCEPWMVEEIVRQISKIKNIDFEDLNNILINNSKNTFGIDF
jgi:TatD DNase family protein